MKKGINKTQLIKRWLLAAVVGFLLFGGGILFALHITPFVFPPYLGATIFALCIFPFFFAFVYLWHRILSPVVEGLSVKGFKTWILGYLFGLTLIFYWAGLAFILEKFFPTLAAEDRVILPLFIIAISLILIASASKRFKHAH